MSRCARRSYLYMFETAESRYNQWIEAHYRFLMRSAWALTGSRSVAEDVVQDCFASAWKHRSQLRNNKLARAWLFQIMRRHALRYLVPAVAGPQLFGGDEGDDEAARQPATDSGLDDQLDVVRTLMRIAPIHREVLVLFYFDDMPTAQMAEALDVAPGTVLSRLARARAALKAVMSPPPAAAESPAPAPLASVIALRKS